MENNIKTTYNNDTATHPRFPNYIFHSDGTITLRTGIRTHGSLESQNYRVVYIKDSNSRYSKQRVHRLIVEAFTGDSIEGKEIDHINGNRQDNRLTNLRIMSIADHRRHTHACNPNQNKKSGWKRGKAVIGVGEDNEEITFQTVLEATIFMELPSSQSGIISKACKEGGTVKGWRFRYVQTDANGEEWKKVIDFPGLNQDLWVSNFGRLKTKRVVTYGNLSGSYYRCNVSINHRRQTRYVHTFVCWAFNGPQPSGSSSVNHKDRNCQNNKPENLEWSDPIHQAQHKRDTQVPHKLGPTPIIRIEGEEAERSDMENLVPQVPKIMTDDEEYYQLRNEFLAVINGEVNGSLINKECDLKSFKYLHPRKWYEDKVFSCTSIEDINKLEIEVKHVCTKQDHHLWNFFRTHTSSFSGSKPPGRYLQFLVNEKSSQKCLGIIAMGSDVYDCGPRDKAIGWDQETKRGKSVSILNIRTCVGLQPVSYNFNVGKLIANLSFSKEVISKFEEIYKDPIAAITTFGINGKSVQYDRLKCMKFIGLTKGQGNDHVPYNLIDRAMKFIEKYNPELKSEQRSRLNKLRILSTIFCVSYNQLSCHGKQRGIYMGYTGPRASEFLTSNRISTFENTLQSVNDITSEWKRRWAHQRFNHLKASNRLDTSSIKWTFQPIMKENIPKEQHKTDRGTYKAAPKPKVVHPRPSIQNKPKDVEHKAKIALGSAKRKREQSGLSDTVIDTVREFVALGKSNKTISEELGISHGVVSKIKNRVTLKISEMMEDNHKKHYDDTLIRPENMPDGKMPKKRKLSPEKTIEILRYVYDTPLSILELHEKSATLFGTIVSKEVSKLLLKGITVLSKKEFPIANTSWDEYSMMLDIVKNRNYRELAKLYSQN